jgi:predicted nucleic acid-binding protein
MPDVFADTAGWAQFFVQSQPFHSDAVALMRRWQADRTRIVTTNYILTELIALLTSPLGVARPRQIRIVDTIRAASWVDVVHMDPTLDAEAWLLLKQRQDKEWSLVDCASFIVMQHRGITEALTTDHHFEQAGFVRLLT